MIYQTEVLRPAEFVERRDRFTVRWRDGSRTCRAHVANPGRMGEILLPGTTVLLGRRPHTKSGWEAVGASWKGRWPGDGPRTVFLNTVAVNRLARRLLEERLVPELVGYEVVRAEIPLGRSRIDFLLEGARRPYLLEVKSVTLVERGLALFPDAETARGRRHILELAGRPREYDAGVLFLVQGEADRFLPDFHNDLEFARAFRSVAGRVDFLPYRLDPVLTGEGRIRFAGRPERLHIPWDLLDAGLSDGGVYLLLLEIPRRRVVPVGSLGRQAFPRGWYVYVGSAKRGLSRRVARHLRRRKKIHDHVDALREVAKSVKALPIRAAPVGECQLAGEVGRIASGEVRRFGCSDCRCGSHLFYFPGPVLSTASFQEMLVRLRHGVSPVSPVAGDDGAARVKL
ncbi:MAG: DNA/RNA nuclease SfsA [Planctomycetota bacterium]|nr:DNA/RNA nuclease SfsA [Planctomycetota bacterium]